MSRIKGLTLENIDKYLNSINLISSVDIQRIHEFFLKTQMICPDKLREIFISNYNESDGKVQFKDIWFFSDSYVIEVLNFVTEENAYLEISKIKDNICDVTIQSNSFDFSKKADNNSKLHISIYTLGGLFNCDCLAYGVNCDYLMSIYNRFIKNNISLGSGSSQTIIPVESKQ
jgi:hypothetical protein